MRITKYGQCCMLIEENDVRIFVDPGSYSTQQNIIKDIDIILITHEHGDHFDIESVKTLVKNNPQAKLFTTHTVGELLKKEDIPFTVIKAGETVTEKGITIEAIGELHAILHSSIPQGENVGFLIAGRLFYPGDAFTLPGKPVDILALPVQGPWLKIGESIDYALAIKPKACFPVHDAINKNPGMTNTLGERVLKPMGIPYTVLELDNAHTF